jgi:hypothetical protein
VCGLEAERLALLMGSYATTPLKLSQSRVRSIRAAFSISNTFEISQHSFKAEVLSPNRFSVVLFPATADWWQRSPDSDTPAGSID